ncbi:hypothetical protein Barb7_01700 [Bacteroidales bacterium Barb7]|nr:hypothetical protein Barb7_01700 [Bacteroidales bacterium Barb7]
MSYHKVIPEEKFKGCSSIIFCHGHGRHWFRKAKEYVYRAYKADYSSRYEFFNHCNMIFACLNPVDNPMGLSVPPSKISRHCSVRYFILK